MWIGELKLLKDNDIVTLSGLSHYKSKKISPWAHQCNQYAILQLLKHNEGGEKKRIQDNERKHKAMKLMIIQLPTLCHSFSNRCVELQEKDPSAGTGFTAS